MRFRSLAAAQAGAILLAGALHAQATDKPLPLKYVGPPTVPGITAGDLMTRLYKYADDSMMGRDVGTVYHLKAAAYLEGELRRMGLKPGGTNGSFYQDFPVWTLAMDPASAVTAGGKTFGIGRDFLPLPGGRDLALGGVAAVYAGMPNDTSSALDSAAVAGRILVNRTFPAGMTSQQMEGFRASTSYRAFLRARAGAAAVLTLIGDEIPAELVGQVMAGGASLEAPQASPVLGTTYVSSALTTAIFGTPVDGLRRGATSSTPVTSVKVALSVKQEAPGRNVVAILPGTDPVLKHQYVAIGAHSDHIGFQQLAGVPQEHDSIKVWNKYAIPAGAEGGRNLATDPITPEEWTRINAEIAALRTIYPPRQDSISNGADDDGSGSVSVLEIAEQFAKGTLKPKRSILFVWHAGEEKGMWGSDYFMEHPTVPRDSIVAQINIDMVGRGAASDVTGQAKITAPGQPAEILHGGNRYVQLVGSRRLSTELGNMVETVNTTKKHGFTLDYHIDADGHQQNIYCRSDHWSYAKWGIPVVFFTTGGHADYHQFTDEPQYIRYDHMAALDTFIFDIAAAVADMPQRPVVDKARPAQLPATTCQQ